MGTEFQSRLINEKTAITSPRDVRPEDCEQIDAFGEKLKHLINYAVLAPSTHNTQPWLFRVSDRTIEVFADRSRALAVIDPDDNGLIISCGAASGMLAKALSAVGFRFHVTHLPDANESDLISRFHMEDLGPPETEWKVTLNAIRLRRSVRAGFKNRILSKKSLTAIRNTPPSQDCHVNWIDSAEIEKAILESILMAEKDRQFDKHYARENATWTHPMRVRSRDGVPAHMEKMPSISQLWAPIESESHSSEKTTLVGLVETFGNRPIQWVRAGFTLASTLVQASKYGLNAAIINHPLQTPTVQAQIETVVKPGNTAQIVIRMGVAERAPSTPRRSLVDVMMHPGFRQ